jgi:S-formylglutathione hydrolase
MTAAGLADSSVLHRLRANADAVRASGLPIFLRVGDRDVFKMHDGTEQLHRALWDLDIGHEYHLVHDADHLGPEAMAAQRAALAFIGKALVDGRTATDRELEAAWRAWASNGREGAPPRLDADSPSASVALRVMLEPALTEAERLDPAAGRRYGKI